MGWKASMIIIHQPGEVDHRELLKRLGFINLNKIAGLDVASAIYPREEEIYIGNYKNNLLICEGSLPYTFFNQQPPFIEELLTHLFPDKEIAVIVLHNVVNLWGFSIIRNGKRIRTRAGEYTGNVIDFGTPLKEEEYLLSKSFIDEETGERMYLLDGWKEPCTEDATGEELVFSVCSRYFGQKLDEADELFDTEFTGYEVAKNLPAGPKPWWKVW
ncbi:hypothetical protein U0035_01900 [Niabella yanshanensis]|uniref:DUF4261 domain-containing protein n=1 Tax=Niabella yanshanensis TaxID=577386 RepID=A0ABZ0W6Y7_9BACT|nr:hypothetical protein [Niabella yanshanensis]WQD38896.1 hypothetical protein U0035_01900 [Niabella yanshanensis]